MAWVAALLLGYLLGSVPWGLLLTRAAGHGDIRAIGSGNSGATNVLRTGSKGLAAATLALVALKGAAALLIAGAVWGESAGLAAGFGAMLGHAFPVWLGFRGGKGVATGVGAFLILAPLAILCAGVIFLAVVALTRYVSLGSITSAAAFPLFVWLSARHIAPAASAELAPLLTSSVACCALIIIMHYANIARLLNGTEGKFW